MHYRLRILFCVIAVLSIIEQTVGKRGSGGGSSHSSGGLSGGGSHSYPSSSGLSGTGHGYPSSGGSHGYPASGGLSGSGSHGNHGHTINNNNYHYNPPQQIKYTPTNGGTPVSYPVYHGTPPTYVYQYQDSGSKYGTLLAGLALLNLGTLAGAAYAVNHGNHGGSGSSYASQPGEVCKFGLKKDNGDYEETKIDCQIITSFILQEEAKSQAAPSNVTTSVITTTVTNVTMVNGTSEPAPTVQPVASTVYSMFPNGTLVPVNMTSTNETANATSALPSTDNTSSMTVTTTTTNTTISNALDVKGTPIPVTPGMKCYVIRQTPTSVMRKTVDCGLLQTYAEKSISKNSAARHAPAITVLAVAAVAFILY